MEREAITVEADGVRGRAEAGSGPPVVLLASAGAWPPRHAAEFARRLPDARVHLAGGSHAWLVSRPDEFAAAVAGFVGAPVPPGGRPVTGC